MNANDNQSRCSHVNVMEDLVRAEIERQTQSYPTSLKFYINLVEVETYALNRLPAFYASSQQGKKQQLKQAGQYQEKIVQEVRRALAAIERDPLRVSQPLIDDRDRNLQIADEARQEISQFLRDRQLIDRRELPWEKLASVVLQSFNVAKWQDWAGDRPSTGFSLTKIPYRRG